jgi:hypothetical protein
MKSIHDSCCIDKRRVRITHAVLSLSLLVAALSQMAVASGGVAAAPPLPGTVTTGVPGPRFIRRLGELASAGPHVGQPVRLKIPTIRVDAAVEQVGKAPDGSMDVPKSFDETAWYQLGARPGEPGNAVIDGHVDSKTGKAVFWDLRKLVRGDQIVVVGDDGVERRFVVADTGKYATADVPLARVFGPATGVHLNLITCDATTTFNYATESYDGNFVVYADAAP